MRKPGNIFGAGVLLERAAGFEDLVDGLTITLPTSPSGTQTGEDNVAGLNANGNTTSIFVWCNTPAAGCGLAHAANLSLSRPTPFNPGHREHRATASTSCALIRTRLPDRRS